MLEKVLAADCPSRLPRGPGRVCAPVRTLATSRSECGGETRVAVGDLEISDDRVRDRGDLSNLVHTRHDRRSARVAFHGNSVSRLGQTVRSAGHSVTVLFVSGTIDSFLDKYIRRYTEGDVRGVTNLCHVPFLAVRRGEAINMPDSGAVWDHFASAIGAYRRAAGVETWKRLETDTRQLGEHSVFASVHWNALDANGKVVRDTWTSYQLLATPEGWRLLSYTNHF